MVVPAVKHRANPVLTCGDLGEWDSRRAGPWASRSVRDDQDPDDSRRFKLVWQELTASDRSEFGWYHPDGTGRYGRYSADIRITHSRDGERFTRIRDDQPLIRRGGIGD